MKNLIELAQEKGISTDDLVATLVVQCSKMPSIAEIAHRSKALSATELLEVFILQSKDGLSFRSACEKINLWKPSLQAALNECAQKSTAELEAILSSRAAASAASLETSVPQSVMPALEITADQRRLLSDLLGEDARTKILSTVQQLIQGDRAGDVLAEIHAGLREVRGIMRFADLSTLEPQAELAEQVAENLIAAATSNAGNVREWAASSAEAFRSYFDAIWGLKSENAQGPDQKTHDQFSSILSHVSSKKEAIAC